MYDSRVKPLNVALLAVALVPSALAQAPAAPNTYDPLKTFAPLTLPESINAYRSSNGAPGPMYWQNRADYQLHAAIDTSSKVLTGSEDITYTNNSPDALTSLWMNLEQNTYRHDARSVAFARRGEEPGARDSTEGYTLDSVDLMSSGNAHSSKPVTIVSDTRMQIQLPFALKHGAKVHVLIHYHYTIPGKFGGRTSWGSYKQGDIFDLAQWYPRMCVYDDLHGWDTQPYLANEFYLEYGNFDYFVTVPSNFLVAGSGELVNAAAVLTPVELKRLALARASDKTVFIRTADEATAAAAQHPTTTRTWHFSMQSTRDVSFTASPAFLWDAARMNIPAGAGKPAHTALAQSVYPMEGIGTNDWNRSTEYLKDSVEHFSARWYPYPWPNAISVGGPTDGMEYPGIIFDGPEDKGKELFWVTAHEIGHSWFPMIVGSNERRNAWIDEGFNTFIDIFESDDFNHGEFGPKRDGEYAPKGGYPADEIAAVIADPEAPPILSRADTVREKYRHPITYFKSAEGLVLLREDILGPARFDFAFRKFIADWAFKHPSPSDFFREMESEGGEDLSYFWRGWYMNNWQLDLSITSAEYVDKANPAKGLRVMVTNRGQLVLPALLRVTLADGSHVDVKVPAETWMQQTAHTFVIAIPGAATQVQLDPDHAIPDADRSNNLLKMNP
jgi:hypothetical protein